MSFNFDPIIKTLQPYEPELWENMADVLSKPASKLEDYFTIDLTDDSYGPFEIHNTSSIALTMISLISRARHNLSKIHNTSISPIMIGLISMVTQHLIWKLHNTSIASTMTATISRMTHSPLSKIHNTS